MSFHMNFFQNLVLSDQPHYKTINNLSYKFNITAKKRHRKKDFLKINILASLYIYYPIAINAPPTLLS